jgi:adenosylmethionine-8-amino-7-oxononanoate aminotransferase
MNRAPNEHLFTLDPQRMYPVLERGQGSHVWDATGKRYLDAIAGIAVVNVGYGRQEVADAIALQAARLPFAVANTFTNEPAIRLAEEISTLTPGDLNWVHFTSGGSEAVEVAIKLARQYHFERGSEGKHLVISRWTSYHGATLGALSATGSKLRRRKYLPLLLEFPHIPPVYCYRCPWELEYPSCSVTCASELERTILEVGAENVAAFIAEPIVGSVGGAIAPQPEYWPMIREICTRYDVVLIADEIITGFGRTGTTFAVDHWNVVPDLLVMGKGISGGYAPLSAVATTESIRDVFVTKPAPFDHIFTFGSNPVSMAAGLAVLEIWRREGVLENVRTVGEQFSSVLRGLREYEFVGDVRTSGLMAGVEFVADRASKVPFRSEVGLAGLVQRMGLDNGIVTYPGTGMADGASGDIISLYPPLTFTPEDISEMGQLLKLTFDQVAGHLEGL